MIEILIGLAIIGSIVFLINCSVISAEESVFRYKFSLLGKIGCLFDIVIVIALFVVVLFLCYMIGDTILH